MSEYYDVEKIKYDKRSKLWLVKFVGYDEPELTLYKDLSEYYQSIYYKNGKLKPHEIKRRRKEAAERRKPGPRIGPEYQAVIPPYEGPPTLPPTVTLTPPTLLTAEQTPPAELTYEAPREELVSLELTAEYATISVRDGHVRVEVEKEDMWTISCEGEFTWRYNDRRFPCLGREGRYSIVGHPRFLYNGHVCTHVEVCTCAKPPVLELARLTNATVAVLENFVQIEINSTITPYVRWKGSHKWLYQKNAAAEKSPRETFRRKGMYTLADNRTFIYNGKLCTHVQVIRKKRQITNTEEPTPKKQRLPNVRFYVTNSIPKVVVLGKSETITVAPMPGFPVFMPMFRETLKWIKNEHLMLAQELNPENEGSFLYNAATKWYEMVDFSDTQKKQLFKSVWSNSNSLEDMLRIPDIDKRSVSLSLDALVKKKVLTKQECEGIKEQLN